MRTRVMLIVLICGLLVACSNSVPSPTTNSLLATPSPVVSTASTPSAPGDPTSASRPQPTLQATSTPSRTVDSLATPTPIPAGPLTIVALGDSLTEGDGDQPGEGGGYPARLQRSINNVRPGSQVINLGKSGWNSQQMIDEQLPAALQANPHIALVWIGSNNLWYNNGPGDGETLDLTNYTNDIDTTLRSLTGAGARVFIALLDDQSLRPYSTSPDGGNFSPDQLAHMTRLARAFNDIIRAKAADYGATTVDFYSTTIFTDPATLYEDGIHPNPSGYDLIAQIWFKAMRPYLQ